MKRVVFVLPHMGIGGVERSFLGLIKHAPMNKVDITLLLLAKGGELLEEVPEWVHIKYVDRVGKAERLRANTAGTLKKMRLNRLFSVAKFVYHTFGPKLIRPDHAQEYDVAVAYSDGIASWYVSKAVCAKRKLAFVHTDFLNARYNPDTEEEIYRAFDGIFLGSKTSMDHFLQLLPECEGKTFLLPNCIDRAKIIKLAQEPCVHFKKETVNLLTVGRLSHEKGLDKIPKILSLMRADGLNVCWYVVGDGPESGNLLSLSCRYDVGDRLVLLGNQKNPYPYMAQCDIYVQPSNYEGFCIALAEARTLKKPAVACDFAGAAEQIRDGVDGFVAGMSVDDIYGKLRLLVQDITMRNAFSQAVSTGSQFAIQELFLNWWDQEICSTE